MMTVVTFVSLAVHVYTIGYMRDDPGLPAVLRLHLAVHVLDADAGDVEQLPAAVLRLGGGRPRLLPADRLLVQAPDARYSRTSRRSSSTASATSASSSASRRSSITPAASTTARCSSARPIVVDSDIFVTPGEPTRAVTLICICALHRRDGQVRAGAAARLAAGFDGRPDADLGADPRRDHGDGRHLHGGAHVAAVRADRRRAALRAGDRRDDGAVHGLPRPRQQRHQARDRLFDAVAARLHDGRAGGAAPTAPASST